MKKYLIGLLLLVLSTTAFAQNDAIISGRIENFPDKHSASYRITSFDTETMSETVENKYIRISDDGSFVLRIDNLEHGFLPIVLTIGSSVSLLISPGDSLFIDCNWWMVKESMVISGIGAEKYNYLIAKNNQFSDNRNQRAGLQRISNPEQYYQTYLGQYLEKVEFFENYPELMNTDSAFYEFERAMIDFEAIHDLFSHYTIYHSSYNESKIPDFLGELINRNETAKPYLQFSSYRRFLNILVNYRIIKESGGGYLAIKPGSKLEWSNSNFSAEIRRVYQSDLVKEEIKKASTDLAKVYLLEYFDTKVGDKQLSEQLIGMRSGLKEKSLSIPVSIKDFALRFLVISLILIAIFILLRRFYILQLHKGVRINISKWIRYSILLIAAVFTIVYLVEMIPYDGILTIFYPLLIIGTLILHVRILIPKLALSGKVSKYWVSVVLLMIVDILLFITLDLASGNNNRTELAYFILQIQFWFSLALGLSWIYYYMRYSETYACEGLKRMTEKRLFNWEYAIITAIALLVNTIVAANAYSKMGLVGLITDYSLVVVFLVLNFVLVPAFIKQRNWLSFIVSIIIIIIAQTLLIVIAESIQTMVTLYDLDVDAGFFDTLSVRYGIDISNLVITVLLLIPAFSYNYIKKLIQDQDTGGYKLFRQKEAELMHLRSQVNPHFLFNSLNSLYAYALQEKNDKTAEPIAKLANLMRFMIDDMDKDSIPLARELEYIRDYAKLQSIRSSLVHDISINVKLEDEDSQIAPMLLIPFVENAFKHGINPNKKSRLKIDLKSDKEGLQFVIENGIDNGSKAFEKEKGFGIGIENVKRRLEFIYPGQHNISIAETDTSYIVILNINN